MQRDSIPSALLQNAGTIVAEFQTPPNEITGKQEYTNNYLIIIPLTTTTKKSYSRFKVDADQSYQLARS